MTESAARRATWGGGSSSAGQGRRRMGNIQRWAVAGLLATCLTSGAHGQGADSGLSAAIPVVDTKSLHVPFKSVADSLEWERARRSAFRTTGFRVVVSLRERQVWVLRGGDTLRKADAAVASGMTIAFAGRTWTFRTPRGKHTVLRKIEDPVWRPPDWLYAEAALEHNLELAKLRPDRPVRVSPDEDLVVRGDRVGLRRRSTGEFSALPDEEHIVFNDTLYIPPIVTSNRQVEGELGRYALDLGDGYLIHGTSNPASIGRAVTHGCIRLGDEDIEWLYRNVPTGTAVHIY
jgi:hypothetical protein